ncbi:DUF4097 family beta strand repeat-containing protein [Lactobacillus sp. ESL0791]|uniref:DUF4097 family beta strand repeat-containing protein n=1 Tax=Lactobacillus sp. ESL0791 TaxID=2983234 RepID=UPI0023F954D0|nr:DUF4097 family beta strand repeat-containing protein [Lactobacillus sp. ESL0791]MDF7637917.1 DUF4097 family beta strand repeat-containing protein [Lactobacillus sp. ESL0791]
MKNFYRAGAITLIIGLILLIVGELSNGLQPITGNSLSELHVYKEHPKPDKKVEEPDIPSRTYKAKVAAFTQVKATTNEANIHIASGKKYQVEITDNKKMALKAKTVNDTLIITQKSGTRWLNRDSEININITVPSAITLSKISLQTDAGDFSLSNLTTNQLELINNAGQGELSNIKANEKTMLKFNSGDLTIIDTHLINGSITAQDSNTKISKSQLAKLHLKITDGKLVINRSQLTVTADLSATDALITTSKLFNNNSFSLADGDFVLRNVQNKLNYSASTDDEEIKYNGKNVGSHFIREIEHNKDHLNVKTVNGDISLS